MPRRLAPTMDALFGGIVHSLPRPALRADFLRRPATDAGVDLMESRPPVVMPLQIEARLVHRVLFGLARQISVVRTPRALRRRSMRANGEDQRALSQRPLRQLAQNLELG